MPLLTALDSTTTVMDSSTMIKISMAIQISLVEVVIVTIQTRVFIQHKTISVPGEIAAQIYYKLVSPTAMVYT